MRTLLRILGGGLAVFLVLAIAQEWRTFVGPWVDSGPEASELDGESREAAESTLYLTLRLMEHFYGSGGDPRFAERMPISERLVEELQRDARYVARNHRRQEMTLDGLEVLEARALGPDRIEIRTREEWELRWYWSASETESEPPRHEVVGMIYLLGREEDGWMVRDWAIVPSSDEGAAEGAG